MLRAVDLLAEGQQLGKLVAGPGRIARRPVQWARPARASWCPDLQGQDTGKCFNNPGLEVTSGCRATAVT